MGLSKRASGGLSMRTSVGLSMRTKPRAYARVSLRACLLRNVLLVCLRVCALLPRDGVTVVEAAIEGAIVPMRLHAGQGQRYPN